MPWIAVINSQLTQGQPRMDTNGHGWGEKTQDWEPLIFANRR